MRGKKRIQLTLTLCSVSLEGPRWVAKGGIFFSVVESYHMVFRDQHLQNRGIVNTLYWVWDLRTNFLDQTVSY